MARNRYILYKKIEGAKVGYRLFNVEHKCIGHVSEKEFQLMVNRNYSSNLGAIVELRKFVENNPDDSLIIVPLEVGNEHRYTKDRQVP